MDTIQDTSESAAEITPKAKTKIRFRVGRRYTYDPHLDEKLGIKSTRPDPNGPKAEYWPNGALKGTRTIGHKIIRRMFRAVARKYGSRIGRRILETQQLHATARSASESGYEAQRCFDAQIAANRKERGITVVAQPKTRSEYRATAIPGRGAYRRARLRDSAVQP